MNKLKPIPPVPFELLLNGYVENETGHGPDDLSASPVQSSDDDDEIETLRAIYYRLRALTKLIREGEGNPWTSVVGSDRLVNEALFKAAARAPLFEGEAVDQASFDRDEFMKIALEETEPGGKA